MNGFEVGDRVRWYYDFRVTGTVTSTFINDDTVFITVIWDDDANNEIVHYPTVLTPLLSPVENNYAID